MPGVGVPCTFPLAQGAEQTGILLVPLSCWWPRYHPTELVLGTREAGSHLSPHPLLLSSESHRALTFV